jgi:hypothetical protein
LSNHHVVKAAPKSRNQNNLRDLRHDGSEENRGCCPVFPGRAYASGEPMPDIFPPGDLQKIIPLMFESPDAHESLPPKGDVDEPDNAGMFAGLRR